MSNNDSNCIYFNPELWALFLSQNAGGFGNGVNGGNGDNGGNGGNGGNPPGPNDWRLPCNSRGPYVRQACKNCKKRHVACSTERPCPRCIRDNVPCVDAEQKPRGRPKGSKNKPKEDKVNEVTKP